MTSRAPDPAHHPLCRWSAWSFDQCLTCESIRLATEAENTRIREGVLAYYAVALKAAEPILRIIDRTP